MTDIEKIKAKDCVRRYLAKNYNSMKDLEKDNNNDEVYYDTELDDTPYDIVKKYKDEQKKMSPADFIEYFAENLIQKHDCPPHMAKELASTIISGKKLVRDGEYAIVVIKPKLPAGIDENSLSEDEKKSIENEADIRKKTFYYRRLKNNWIQDTDINEEAFFDTNTIFCNISSKCYKNANNKVCETLDDTATRLQKITQRNLLNEFDKRYNVTVEELERELENNLEYFRKLIIKLQIINEIQLYRANNLAYNIGKLSTIEDIIVSPYEKLRDMILNQDDFTKKQYDIVRFVNKFCREPMVDELDENPHWKYCLSTNAKLLPAFLYRLAETFISGGDYADKLAHICNEIGLISDDGDSIVDKHSGYVIRKIDFSTEEGYDQAGFHITTHAIMEKDLGTVMMETLGKKEKRIFEDEKTQMMYNVFATISSNIDITVDGIEDFVLRISKEIMEKAILKEDAYKKQLLAAEKENKDEKKPKLVSYTDYTNEMIIMIIASSILVSIQTAVPSFQTKKTFPGCVRSFSGYPLNGVEDVTGIKYIACVIEKSGSTISYWKSIQKLKNATIAIRMKKIIDKYFMKRNDINDLYLQKREFLILNPEHIQVEEHSITRWLHFLPPVVNYNVTRSIRNVTPDFKNEFIKLLRDGNYAQHEYYSVLKSKTTQFGYAIIETINKIVKSKELLLKTSTKIPFIENACCNENDKTNPITYFNEEDENLNVYINSTKKIASLLKDVKEISRAAMLYHPYFTGIKYPGVPLGHLEENIYGAFIHYCNFDRNLPIPNEYKIVCNEKPSGYQPNWSLHEKCEFLKKNGKRYTVEHLNQLLNYVYQKNLVYISRPLEFTKVDVLNDIIETLDRENSTVIDAKMREHLRNVISNYKPNIMVYEASDQLNDLKDYLYTTNDTIYRLIQNFFTRNGNSMKSTEKTKILSFLQNIHKWNKGSQTNLYNDEELFTFTQYIKNAIQSMSIILPNKILNTVNIVKYDDKKGTPLLLKNWKFSPVDLNKIVDIIDKYYENIQQFMNDTVLLRFLQKVTENLRNLNKFVENIQIITPIKKDGKTFHSLFDRNTIISLHIYAFYTVLYEFIDSSDDEDLLRIEIEVSKSNRRERREENNDEATIVGSTDYDELDEDIIERNEDLEEINVTGGDFIELKNRVCYLLFAFLDIEDKNKKAIDFSYENISSHVNRYKDKEKDTIIKFLGKMSPEDRKIEDSMKKFKMGRWNVGMQKGLVNYDAETNQRETKELLNILIQDVDDGVNDVVTEMMRDVYNIGNNEDMVDVEELDIADEDIANEEADLEAYDIGGLDEEYNDGVYYEEDRDEDF